MNSMFAFFDLDDTLYSRKEAFFSAVEKYFGITDFQLKNNLSTRCRIRGDEVFFDCQKGLITSEQMYEYRFVQGFLDCGIQIKKEQAFDFQKVYQKDLYSLKLSNDVIEILNFIKTKFEKIGIITNGPKEHQWNKIEKLGLLEWVNKDLIIISGEHGIDKPDLKIFEIAKEKTFLSCSLQTDMCAVDFNTSIDFIFVGDSFENDIIPAHKMGWHSVWLNLYEEKKQVPEFEIKNICELKNIFLNF